MINGDDLIIKDSIIAELYGQVKADLENKGLTNGEEFKVTIQRIFSSSRRLIHVYDMDDSKKYQLVIIFNSGLMKVEYGIADKELSTTVEKHELNNLRYKISSGEQRELIESHQAKWSDFRQQILISLQQVDEMNK